jgi:hypothetical protein
MRSGISARIRAGIFRDHCTALLGQREHAQDATDADFSLVPIDKVAEQILSGGTSEWKKQLDFTTHPCGLAQIFLRRRTMYASWDEIDRSISISVFPFCKSSFH